MANYATRQLVFDKVGVDNTVISDDQMDRILVLADAEVDRIISSTCVPKTRIEVRDGDNQALMYIRNVPLMKVIQLEIDDTAITIDKITFRTNGEIRLNSDAEQVFFFTPTGFPRAFNNVRIKYQYGWLEETDITSDITVDAVAGLSSTVTVADGSLFAIDDFVKIVGFDGFEEQAKITAIATNDLTIDLVSPHEIGSLVTKLEVPPMVVQLAAVLGAIMAALFQMGATFTFATSYQTPDYQVSKGVPYPHFQKVLDASVQERDFIMTQLPRWPAFS